MIKLNHMLAMAVLASGGCADAPPTRPKGVPAEAVWSGGPDGGNWFACDVDTSGRWNACSVYADVTGAVIEKGRFRLAAEGRAARVQELQFAYYSLGEIHLKDGKTLVRIDGGAEEDEIS